MMACNDVNTVLHWNYRGFTEFPFRELQDGGTITDIYLKENLISHLPSDIGRLDRLESLYLSGNDISELPVEIGKLRHLKCLDVSGNRLSRLPDEIADVVSLKFLILDDNELTELPLRLAELRTLRYLSVCDNKLRWLPQRPVYNYHHCEFRFWRNSELKVLPYSLWNHMFRDQQTRSLNIGCLGTDSNRTGTKYRCRLELRAGAVRRKIELPVVNYLHIIPYYTNTPPSLFELCKRCLYNTICEAARGLSKPCSIYADSVRDENDNELPNADVKPIQAEFYCGKDTRRHYVPKDIVERYFNYLPKFMRADLNNGPVSRCENAYCKRPIFDYVTFQFCFGKILLIDNVEYAILSATFCSKTCIDAWKRDQHNLIPWTLIETEYF